MKVLFVASGNTKSSIVRNQGNSLLKIGIEVSYYYIKGKGIGGYLKNWLPLKRKIIDLSPDLIHAHYSFCGILASLTSRKSIIVSLMGSDIKLSKFFKVIAKIFIKSFWSYTIVKSNDSRITLKDQDVKVLPNGVNIDRFKQIDKTDCQKFLCWSQNKNHILFAADPDRREKNYRLAKKAMELINDSNLVLHSLESISNELMPYWYNASDVVLLTSLWEGSPNVIKEAMACNCVVVSVDVGDVKEVIGGIPGCFIASHNPEDVSEKIKLAIEFSAKVGRTNGRDRIIETGLDSETVAKKILDIYNSVLGKNDNYN